MRPQTDDERFRALFGATAREAARETIQCRRCNYVTLAAPLDEAELWHYGRTGESRFGGCPRHPWGWHYWNTDKKPPPVYRLREAETIAS